MTHPSGAPPGNRRRTRAAIIAGITATASVVAMANALAHSEFPSAQNPDGRQATPYTPATKVTIKTKVPGERDGAAGTTGVRVTPPAGWTEPECGKAYQGLGELTAGTELAGWTCTLAGTAPNQTIDFSGPRIAPDDAEPFFSFGVKTPSPSVLTAYGARATSLPSGAATAPGFEIRQTYSSAENVTWRTPDAEANDALAVTSMVRWVSPAAAEPTPTPTPTPTSTPTPTPTGTPTPGSSGTQSISAVHPGTPAGGNLSVSFADTGVGLEAGTPTATYLPYSGSLNPITLTDQRGGAPAWTVSGQSSNFTPLPTSAQYLGWKPAVTNSGAGGTAGAELFGALGATPDTGLSAARTLASAVSGHASGTSTLGALMNLRLPAGIPGGTYRGTVTITVF